MQKSNKNEAPKPTTRPKVQRTTLTENHGMWDVHIEGFSPTGKYGTLLEARVESLQDALNTVKNYNNGIVLC